MKINDLIINTAAKMLLDKRLWLDARMFVTEIDGQSHLSNAEKRDKVKQDLLVIFDDVSSVILNLAIELAVAWLKSQLPTQE